MKNKVLIAVLFIGLMLVGYYSLNIIFPAKEAMFQTINLKTNLVSLSVIGLPIVIMLISIIFKKSIGILIATIVAYVILLASSVYYLVAMGIQLFNPLIYLIMLILPVVILLISNIINKKTIKDATIMFNILSYSFIIGNIIILMTQNDSKLMLTQLTIKLIITVVIMLISIISYFFNRLIGFISVFISSVIVIVYLIISNDINIINQEMLYNIILYLYPYLIYICYIEQSHKNT